MHKYWLSSGLAVFLVAPAVAQTPLGPVPSTQALSIRASTEPVLPAQGSGGGADSIYTTTTVNEFLTDCRTDQSGCMAEIGNALLKNMNQQDVFTICLNDVNYGAPVPNWLTRHPETHMMPTENGIFLALQKLYPCTTQ
jgi:hypothetical protein